MGKVVITSLGYMLPDYTFNIPLKKKSRINKMNETQDANSGLHNELPSRGIHSPSLR